MHIPPHTGPTTLAGTQATIATSDSLLGYCTCHYRVLCLSHADAPGAAMLQATTAQLC